MGSEEFVRRLHSGPTSRTKNFTRLKEALELGYFTELYNATGNGPKLVWARANARGSGHADFTVWDQNKRWSRDLELTSACVERVWVWTHGSLDIVFP